MRSGSQARTLTARPSLRPRWPLARGPALRCVHSKHSREGRSIFSHSTENGPAFLQSSRVHRSTASPLAAAATLPPACCACFVTMRCGCIIHTRSAAAAAAAADKTATATVHHRAAADRLQLLTLSPPPGLPVLRHRRPDVLQPVGPTVCSTHRPRCFVWARVLTLSSGGLRSAVRACIPGGACGKPNVLLTGGKAVFRDVPDKTPLWE